MGSNPSQQQAGEAVGLTQRALGAFPHHVGEGTSQGPMETGHMVGAP